MKSGFWGGVSPPSRKHSTAGTSPKPAPRPGQLVFPLLQYDGVLCEALVKPGDLVCAGERIAGGKGSVPVHASVSGRVVAIEQRPHPGGYPSPAIVIENDYQSMRVPGTGRRRGGEDLSPEAILDIISDAGIAGQGGVAFPLYSQRREPLEYMILNACECEPYVTADDSLMCSYPEQILSGARLIAQMLRPRRIILAVEDNKPRAIETMRAHMEDGGPELRVLPARYPQGAKQQLVQAVAGREIPLGGTEWDAGCAVYNVATCASVHKAVWDGEPIMRRIVTVTGGAVKNPGNFITLIGTPISHIIEAAGGFSQKPYKVIAGGPMMGKAQATLDAPIVRNINAVLCLGEEDRVRQEQSVCLRCGKCLAACPMRLQPLYFYRYEQKNALRKLRALHPEDCIECGCCSYVCPGKVPLVEVVQRVKKRLEGEAVCP